MAIATGIAGRVRHEKSGRCTRSSQDIDIGMVMSRGRPFNGFSRQGLGVCPCRESAVPSRAALARRPGAGNPIAWARDES